MLDDFSVSAIVGYQASAAIRAAGRTSSTGRSETVVLLLQTTANEKYRGSIQPDSVSSIGYRSAGHPFCSARKTGQVDIKLVKETFPG